MITEFEILKLLNGFPFILNLHFCFQSANYLFMILDFCSNGDISELKYVNNPKLLIAEIILAIEYMHKKNNKIYAMKVMNKNIIIEKKYFHYMMTEYEILKLLNGNPFILNLYFCFQSANYLFMVLDYCSNGDLSSLKKISNAKLLISEILLAIEYMHEKNILYRDLKPENILLDSEGHIKICDFNLAKKIDTKNNCAYSFCGSPLYLSPEMVEKKE